MNKEEIKQLTNINENIDYFKLGLKCGLEIHQQLDTKKLFCNCESKIQTTDDKTKPDYIITRKLRATKSELGVVDAAALFELKKSRLNIYHGMYNSSCLVELDEEPPHEVNKNALKITLEVAKFFNMQIVDRMSFMRKIVVDGSNTSGFQRTALIASGGCIEENNVNIESLCLEEDACNKIKSYISKDNEFISEYDLSRLGIPLIEIATAPDIKSPNQAKEVAEFIGMVLRSTGKVKRGIGTIRQDVNVSIKNGIRVEIKGVQQIDLIPTLITYEIMRQKNLINIYNRLKELNLIISEPEEVTDIFIDTNSKIIKKAIDNHDVVFALKLTGYKGFLGLGIQPGKRFGTEIAGQIKPFGIKGLFHSDELLSKYSISRKEIADIESRLSCDKDDAFIIIAEEKEKTSLAMNEIKKFLSELSLKKEVRQPLPDGTTAFLRPMPGAARMYPETDVPALEITQKLLKEIQNIKLLSDQYKEIHTQFGITLLEAKSLIKSGFDITKIINKYKNLSPKFITEFLLDYPKEIKRRYSLEININNYLDEILEKLNSKEISKEASFEILVLKSKNKKVDYSKFKSLSIKDIEKVIKEIFNKNKNAPQNAIMGLCMKELRGKVEGKLVKKMVEELFNNVKE